MHLQNHFDCEVTLVKKNVFTVSLITPDEKKRRPNRQATFSFSPFLIFFFFFLPFISLFFRLSSYLLFSPSRADLPSFDQLPNCLIDSAVLVLILFPNYFKVCYIFEFILEIVCLFKILVFLKILAIYLII